MPKIVKCLSVILVLLTCSNIALASNYEMSVGIPDTPLDFTQEMPNRPTNWENETAGYYYIDYALGSDSVTYGSEAMPRKTLPIPIPAGSYIEIAGDYSKTSGGIIKVYAEGTDKEWVAGADGPVWITSSKNSPAYFTKAAALIWGENIYLTNVNSKEGSKIQVGSPTAGYPAANIVVRDSNIVGTATMGTGALLATRGASPDSGVKNVIFFNNTITDAGDMETTEDIDAGLIYVGSYSSYVWVLQNEGYNASGTALQINAKQPREYTHHIYAGSNHFYNARQSGLWVKYAQNVVFSENHIHDIKSTSWSPSKGIGGQYEPDGLWIINNQIHDVEYGIRIPSTSRLDDVRQGIYIIGNIIYNIKPLEKMDKPGDETAISDVGTGSSWESAAIHIHGAEDRYIYNNFIFNAPNGINLSSQTSANTSIINNVIEDLTNGHEAGSSGYHIWSEKFNKEELLISKNYFSEADMSLKLGASEITDAITLNAMQRVIGAGNITSDETDSDDTNNINSDENDEIDDISLSIVTSLSSNEINTAGWESNSDIWDAGENVYSELNDTFSATVADIAINEDYLGNSISILDKYIDIGPFQREGENPNIPTPPTAPSGVVVENN